MLGRSRSSIPIQSLAACGLLLAACATTQPAAPAKLSPAPAALSPSTKPAVETAPWSNSRVSDWSTAPKPGPEPSFKQALPTHFVLKNGLEVQLLIRHALPLVSARLIVLDAGYAADPALRPGLADYTADLLDEGAGKGKQSLNALQIAAETERLGAHLWTDVDADWSSLKLDSLVRTFPQSLALLAKLLTQPRFSKQDAKRIRDLRLDALARRADRPREVAELVFARALYGAGTPYGHAPDGSKATLSHFNAGLARGFYKQHYLPAKMRLVVVGDLEADAARALLEKTLGGFHPRGHALASPSLPSPIAQPPRYFLVNRKGAAQSDLRAGLVSLARSDPRGPTFSVLTTVLGGGFTSRINHRLREELGYTYGAYAGLRARRGPGPFVIGTALHTPHTAQGVKEILRLVGELSNTEIPNEELTKAKYYLIRALPGRFETNGQSAETYAELWGHALPMDWYSRYAMQVAKVDAKQVKALAAMLIPEKKLIFSIVGDQAIIGDGLKALLGAPTLRDDEGAPLPDH